MPRLIRPSSRRRMPRRWHRSRPMSAASSNRAAPGRTAGRQRWSSTSRNGRVSKLCNRGRVDLRKRDWRRVGRRGLLILPCLFIAAFLVVPLALTIVISFWERVGLKFRPAFSLTSYIAIIEGARLDVLLRTFIVSVEATALSLLISYPIAYFLARKASPSSARAVLLL